MTDLAPATLALDLIWKRHAAAIPGLFDRRPDFRFDPDHYGSQQARVDRDPVGLARHYEQQDKEGRRPPTFYAHLVQQHPRIDRVLADLVIDPDLAAAIAAAVPDACQLACELIHLGAPVDANVSDFSARAYLRAQGDIAKAGMDPLLHYLVYGAAEGRASLRALRKGHHRGRTAYSPDRPTCLIAVHEFSRTGAPIVGLDIVREAAQTHNVIVLSLKDGELFDDFREFACEIVVTDKPFVDFSCFTGEIFAKIDFAITNSVECWSFVQVLVAQAIPFAAYVHEFADYTFPAYKSTFTALFTDLLVFSSDHVRESWSGRLKDIEFDTARDTMILPQRQFVVGGVEAATLQAARARLSQLVGRDLSEVRLICGAGHLQWRKGPDIFAMTAQICANRDPNTVFIWIGDGLNAEDIQFGAWMAFHLRQIDADSPQRNLFLLPAGPAYPDVLAASDVMFVSSRLDPLPNVVFDALDNGCRIVQFEGASGFGDPEYRVSDQFRTVEYANPDAAAAAILALPRKQGAAIAERPFAPSLFDRLRTALFARLAAQRYFVRGASDIDLPVILANEDPDPDLRVRQREKILRYRRRFIWRDLSEVEHAIAASDNWVHRNLRLAPYGVALAADVPAFSMHIHAFYTEDLADDLQRHCAYQLARRIVVTTDTAQKADRIGSIMASAGLDPQVIVIPNRGRDILPFMDLFQDGGPADGDEIWCHIHQKKSIGSSSKGDIWRQFLMRILLGDQSGISNAASLIGAANVGLVAPFEPYHIPWNAARRLLPKFAARLPGPMPDNPLLFPVGNMFWTRRKVVLAMNAVFGPDYPWPNEPIANDGTEFHLIERLWPAMASQCGLESVFVHKLDQKRV